MSERGAGEVELEIRLGLVGEGFSPGVSKEAFEQLEADLLESEQLVPAERPWAEHVDYHYLDARGRRIRTRVHFDADAMAVSTVHVQKEVLERVLVRRPDGTEESARISVARETPVHDPPGSCVPTHVRVTQRRSFHDVRGGEVIWAYELSKTWSANSRSAVEYRQHECEPVYEVECELVDAKGTYLSSLTPQQVADSITLKAKLLLGADPEGAVVVAAEGTGGKAAPRGKRSGGGGGGGAKRARGKR